MNPTQKPTHTPAALADLTPADILRCAARYLERRGWTQGEPYELAENPPFPPACTLGAITMAVYGYPATIEDRQNGDVAPDILRDNTVRCLADFLWSDGRVPEPDYYGGLCCSNTEIVSDWNDDATQTLPDVLDILRACADDYDWTHATEDQLETYAEHEYSQERLPTRAGFLVWRATR
ncbi:hypothetical protein ACFYPX_29130 [Micromonospora zamorensis]|uniref:DUF6197 family protein n=1 Tax=Micromonospora zamorensis TaxID=709883 RepID=UPI0036BD0198